MAVAQTKAMKVMGVLVDVSCVCVGGGSTRFCTQGGIYLVGVIALRNVRFLHMRHGIFSSRGSGTHCGVEGVPLFLTQGCLPSLDARVGIISYYLILYGWLS